MERKTTRRGMALAAAMALCVALAPAPAHAENDTATNAAAAFCSLLYAPTKIAFAGLGTVVSGLAWAMTGFDGEAARPIFYSTVRGDYLITPNHLEGRRPVEFVGRDPRDEPPREAW